MAELRVVALPGDGVGPEVTAAARVVLEAVVKARRHRLSWDEREVGYAAWRSSGTPIADETLEACHQGPAVFLGAVGDPRADALPPEQRPEAALLRLRSSLGCFANLRPAKVDPALAESSALRPEIAKSCDFVIVRELTGGLYYGTPRGHDAAAGRAVNTMAYTDVEVERVARVAFALARKRRKRVTSVDKANVLEVSRLWREGVTRVAASYPDVALDHMYVDRAAMEIVLSPGRFDVLLMENLFGDILSDEAAAVCGSLGVLPSASLGGAVGLYEPVHGSAPDIAGHDAANPAGAIRSAAMMLAHSFGLEEESRAIEAAVSRAWADGLRTRDVAGSGPSVGTKAFANAVAEAIR
ncbi:MAG: 3-isopropylmalate dehydrogenase [Longimicrobiales bacterium]